MLEATRQRDCNEAGHKIAVITAGGEQLLSVLMLHAERLAGRVMLLSSVTNLLHQRDTVFCLLPDWHFACKLLQSFHSGKLGPS